MLSRMHGVARRTLIVAAAIAVALVAASGSTASNSTRQTKTRSTEDPTLNVTIGAGTVTFGAMYIALVEGLFARNHVNVHVVSNNGVAIQGALLVGGQTDLLVTAGAGALAIRARNQPVKMVMDITNYDYRTLALVGSGKFQTMQDLVSAGSSCKIGSASPGTAAYAYLKIVQQNFGLQCSVLTFATTPAVVSALVSGQVDAIVTGPIDAANLGKQNYPVVLNPFSMPKDVQQKVAPTTYPFAVIAGLDSTLKAKSVAVQRFVESMRQALALIQGLKVAKLGEITSRDTAAFPNTPIRNLTETWSLVKHQVPSGEQAGFISQAAYTALLKGLIAGQQAGISLTDPNLSYSSAIDMSYFNATKSVPLCKPGRPASKGHKAIKAEKPSLKHICRLT